MQTFRIYTKYPDQKKYSALDCSTGTQVFNLIYATLIPEQNLSKAKNYCIEAAKSYKGLKIQVRDLNNTIIFSV